MFCGIPCLYPCVEWCVRVLIVWLCWTDLLVSSLVFLFTLPSASSDSPVCYSLLDQLSVGLVCQCFVASWM